jgi:hypothetical protein
MTAAHVNFTRWGDAIFDAGGKMSSNKLGLFCKVINNIVTQVSVIIYEKVKIIEN